MKLYDHIIVGTGQGTGTLLGGLIPTGESIAVIEGNKVGGSCVNYGCTPTKTLVACAKAIHQARRGAFYGFQAEPKVNFERVMERMNEVREASSDGLTNWMKSTPNVDLIYGWAVFEGEMQLRIGDQKIEGKNIYLNTGTSPSLPPIAGIENVPWMDSERLLELKELPSHLLIIGGGYIGVELAQVFRRLGSKITLIQRSDQLMPQEDTDIANAIKEILEEEEIHLLMSTAAKQVTFRDNQFQLNVERDGQSKTITGSHLLLATGRKPNSKNLGLETAGIEVNEKGYIKVDDHCQTTRKNVFAVGDVNGKGAFTHTAVNDGEMVLNNRNGGNRKVSDRIPIYALFTDPPLGRVGMSEKEALATGRKILMATLPMSEISRAKEMGETKGLAKLLVDADNDHILGAAILGPGGDEIVNMFAAIMHSNIPCVQYRKVVLVHPTVSELMPYVLDGLVPIN